ncbi:TlpA family protein disulfide reductase [Ichthyenterobacterium magnum]|uniref:Thioredoxin domain-containing protein n=1 Tax=Ichthyenterobacterium magnum TaxID=1230530 RepID=A0A420DLQ8_9FLAO|nr:hypothetical protein [Ichthyenterobacterium magnum]RKE95125.1 hypothetical protein BXY80_1310 [Ichthyenterobacterium magnum]
MKLYIVTLLTALSLIGCKDKTTEDSGFTYFGGVIINPNNNYVIISGKSAKMDTLYLDSKNRFHHKIKNLGAGMYTFAHGGEYQMMVLEPNDSLLIRLNTNAFDESLVFTGKGSKKNNFLIKSFLRDEKANKKIIKYNTLEPELFETLIDSVKTSKLNNLELFLDKIPSSDFFKKIAKANINYNYYTYKEIYPFGYYGKKQLVHFKDLPDGFYDFRSEIDYNDNELTNLAPYNRFLFWHFSNLALKNYYKNSHDHHDFNRMSLDYNLEKLNLIDTLVEDETIKNYLLEHHAREFIFNSKNNDESNKLLNSYLEKNTNKKSESHIKRLVESMSNLTPGNKLPYVEILDFGNNTISLSSVIKQPTVIYFWSSNFKMHYRNSHYAAKELKEKYPDVNFIAINMNDTDLNYWKKTLKQFKYSVKNEYKLKNPNVAFKKLALEFSSKAIIVDAKAKIINSNTNLFSEDLGIELENLLAKNKKALK